LEGLIAGLSDANVQTRRLAMADLRESGDAAAVALIRVLADPQRAAEQSTALQALVALGSMSEAPLLGALQARQSEVRRLAATALGRLESRAAIPFLLRPLLDPQTPPDERRACEEAFRQMVGSVPDLAEAQRFLTRAIRRNMASQLAAPSDVQEMPVAWLWDDQQHTVAAHPMEDAALSRWTTQRLAQDLYDLLPESTEARTLWLAALLEWAQVDAGLDTAPAPGVTPAGSRAAATGTAAVEEALAFALEQGQVSAAVGALSVLQTIGDERLLWGAGGVPRTVARALRHPDLRVRCTAARTVIAWDPATPFAGSSHLVEVLAHCARAVGERRVIVAHPQTDFARDIAGMLVELGFQAEIAVTGDSLVKQAVASPDCEAILVSDAIDNAPVKEVVQHLRHDARTARLPIGILTREAYLPEMERFAEGDPWTRAFPRAHDMMGIMLQMRQLLALQDATAITADSRLQWAQMALDYFARVAADTRHYLFPEVFAQEETLIAALAHPGLSARAAQVLGALGSPRAQQALVQLASQNDRGLPQRRSAAAGFALAVERRGLLLSRPEILTQYDRYNRSGGLDRETQQVLGSLLDSIEAPSRTKQ
jgi:HEAT repeat protein